MTSLIVFILGLIFGSFLSVVFSRLETEEKAAVLKGSRGKSTARRGKSKHVSPWPLRIFGARFSESVVRGRSRCDHCRKPIAWYDNIPVISFLVLSGRCRHCRKPISHYHPVLELSAALYLVAAYLYYGLTAQFAVAAGFGLILLLIFAYDLRHQIIPNALVLPAILAALLVLLGQFLLIQSDSTLQLTLWSLDTASYLLGGAVSGGFFLLMSLVSRGAWIGGGDIKLGLLLGLLLGWPHVLVALVLAYFIGTAYAVALLAGRHATLKTNVAFGPMLVMGFFISAFYGDLLVRWYQGLVIPGVGV